jgi:hypothetical protein
MPCCGQLLQELQPEVATPRREELPAVARSLLGALTAQPSPEIVKAKLACQLGQERQLKILDTDAKGRQIRAAK